MKATLKNFRQSPRKIRLVASLVKGKSVPEAMAQLDFLAKRGAMPIRKLLNSAVANAKGQGMDAENLFIKELRVDKGVTLKRIMPAAMGSAHRINKRASHVALVLGEKVAPIKKSATKAKAEPKTEAKKAPKAKAKTTKATKK